MGSEKGNDLQLATIVIPGNEGNRRVEVMLLHLPKKAGVVEISVRLTQPWIVDCEVLIRMGSVPPLIARRILYKHHCRRNSEKGAYNILVPGEIHFLRCCAGKKYYLTANPAANEYRKGLVTAPQTLNLLRGRAVEHEVGGTFNRGWCGDIGQLRRYAIDFTKSILHP